MIFAHLLGVALTAGSAGAAAPGLPHWYLEHRTHAHTRLEIDGPSGCRRKDEGSGGVGWNCSAVFTSAGARFASLGVPAYVRHSHSGAEGLMWPSKTSPKEGWHPLVQETGRHLPTEFLTEAKAAGVRVIFYHYMKCQPYFATRHPEWVQRTANGSAIGAARCPEGALSTCAAQWRRTYIAQILELVEAGAAAGQDGTAFYFDEYPSTPTGDWSPSCRSEFAKRFGYPMPDNATRDVLALNQAMTEEYFEELVQAISGATSRAAALVSITFAPSLDNHAWKNYTNTVEASFSAQSVAKVEFAKGLVARPVSSKHHANTSNASCTRGWSPAIAGKSPGSTLGQANASSYPACQAACCAHSGCLAVIYYPASNPKDNCHLLDRTYEGKLQCLPDHAAPVVANRHGGGVPPSVCPVAGPQVVPGAPIARDVLLSWAWALGSAADEWRPPHTWVPFLKSAEQAACTTSAVRAYGHVANPDHVETQIPNQQLFGEVYATAAILDKASKGEGGLLPVALRYAAVVHSERARNSLYANSKDASVDGASLAAAWKQLLYPAAGMWEELVRSGVPSAVLPEWSLEKLASKLQSGGEGCGFSVLFAPAKGFLDSATEAALEVCQQQGGTSVLRASRTDDWEDPASRERLGQAMLGKAVALHPPPLSFATRQSAAAPRHVVAYKLEINSTTKDSSDAHQAPLLVHVLNDFGWCSPDQHAAVVPPPAPPVAAGLKLLVSAPRGGTATAHDVITGKKFPLARSPGKASQLELTLPGFKQFLVLRLDFAMPSGSQLSLPGGHVSHSSSRCSVRDFGAKGDNITEDTGAVQMALDACPTVIFSAPGKYLLRPVVFRHDNLAVIIETGATVVAWGDVDTWNTSSPDVQPLFSQGGLNTTMPGHVLANFSMSGGGVIDGQGWRWWPFMKTRRRPELLHIARADGLVISNLTFKNSPSFHISVRGNNMEIAHTRVEANMESCLGWNHAPNTDAFNIGGHNIHLHDLWAHNGDDCVPTNPGPDGTTSNVLVERVHCECGTNGGVIIVPGSRGKPPLDWQAGGPDLHPKLVSDVVFRHMDIHHTNQGAGFKISEAYENTTGMAQNVTWEHISIYKPRNTPIYLNVFTEDAAEHECKNPETGAARTHWLTAKNFTFKDIVATIEPGGFLGCFNCGPTRPCEGLRFENVSIRGGNASSQFKCLHAKGTSAHSVPKPCLLQPSTTPLAMVPTPPPILAGAHYFAGWSKDCPAGSKPGCYSHFHGFTPTGKPTSNWFPSYPERTPLLGMYTTDEATVAREVAAADMALDFFDVLYYDGGSDCGPNPDDPGLNWCLDSSLAFMLNSTTMWQNVTRMHFFISYSNDIDRNHANCFVGPAGDAKWAGLIKTWSKAMAHPRYLKVNGRPVFKILIPEIFVAECGSNATLATERLGELRAAARALGLGNPLIGGGWENPSVPAGVKKPEPRPHPAGYMHYPNTKVACPGGCTIKTVAVTGLRECHLNCNTTSGCVTLTLDHTNKSCELLSQDGPGAPDPNVDTYVRVSGTVQYEWTGTYNAAPPVCRTQPNWQCARYKNSWMPNRTAHGGEVFPYTECGDYQGSARTNHSHDRVPYLANVIAGFDPRPWEEHAPSFAMPSQPEWEAVIRQVKAQCEEPANRFGFPDASAPNGFQPAFNIYAWNEYGEGGILAPSQGQGYMKVQTLAKVLGRSEGLPGASSDGGHIRLKADDDIFSRSPAVTITAVGCA